MDRSAGNKLPRGEGLYSFSVPTGLAVKRVEIGLKRGFVVTAPGMSEELAPMEIDRLLVGQVIWGAGRSSGTPIGETNYKLISIRRSRGESVEGPFRTCEIRSQEQWFLSANNTNSLMVARWGRVPSASRLIRRRG